MNSNPCDYSEYLLSIKNTCYNQLKKHKRLYIDYPSGVSVRSFVNEFCMQSGLPAIIITPIIVKHTTIKQFDTEGCFIEDLDKIRTPRPLQNCVSIVTYGHLKRWVGVLTYLSRPKFTVVTDATRLFKDNPTKASARSLMIGAVLISSNRFCILR